MFCQFISEIKNHVFYTYVLTIMVTITDLAIKTILSLCVLLFSMLRASNFVADLPKHSNPRRLAKMNSLKTQNFYFCTRCRLFKILVNLVWKYQSSQAMEAS